MPPIDALAASRTGRLRVGLGAAIVLLIVGVGVTVLVAAVSSAGGSRTVIHEPAPTGSPSSSAGGHQGASSESALIYVHLLGAIQKPGLYQLRDGDRAIDAIAAAGGYTDAADRRQLNLARYLSDGEQIYIPELGEVPAPEAGTTVGSGGSVIGGKVNLNTADSAALETLPRVGPALASRIIAWREANGRFSSIEDLMSVSGVGEKTFAGLKDLVTI